MSDYKNTLNLPATNFPMKANLANREGRFPKNMAGSGFIPTNSS